MPRRICVVSGSRADYGFLYWPMRLLQEAPDFELQVCVTGMHLDPAFGLTWQAIEKDGFQIDARVPMLEPQDTAVGVTKSIGQGVIGFADALDRLRPELLMVLGDRFEILAAVEAALVARIPVAHLCGGDVTEGAFDEAIRHCITKMSHLHFVSNADSARRVRQLGEDPAHVFNVGSSALDRVRRFEPMDRAAFFRRIGLVPQERNLLVTFHPVTLDPTSSLEQLDELLAALASLEPAAGLLVTGPNADTEGRQLTSRLEAFVAGRDHAVFRVSLGDELYLNALRHVDAVVGNSSSGLYEAPSFETPTVDIGQRQRGRVRAASVVWSPPERTAIRAAIERALDLDCRGVENPYGDGNAAPRILDALRSVGDPASLVVKPFFDLEWP